MPPKVIKCDLGLKLYGGFGRHEIFDDLEYEVWIYDVYRECVDTRNELQTGIDDVLEDASISDNGSFKSKPATKDDYVNILTKRINTQGWDTKKCEQWFESIEHCLNDKQISEAFNKDRWAYAIDHKYDLGKLNMQIEWSKTSDPLV